MSARKSSLRSVRFRQIATIAALLAIAATAVVPAIAGSTLQETLIGRAVYGVMPEGQALADESQFDRGGPTYLLVQVKNLNLPDGTVLGVTLDFRPVGTIILRQGEGMVIADLGHFAVSNDQVRITWNGTTIMMGSYFK